MPLLTNYRSCCIRHRSQLGQCKIRSPMSAKKKRLKCAHPGREMLLIYCISPKVTELWESGLCGCFRLALTQLHCPFFSFKNMKHWYSISQTDTNRSKWCWWNIVLIFWLQRRDTELTLNKWALSLSLTQIIGHLHLVDHAIENVTPLCLWL